MNSNRQLGITTGAQSKSSEKLSSGYRINRAGDDAAGLKISEKMRSQVRGLTRASTNAQDGVSLIQTAEGALNEAHSILQRMNELAVQGSNDTNEGIDRDAINEELTALTEELDRISQTTQFNKQNLLDGSFQSKNLHVGANANQKIAISIDNMNSNVLGLRSIKGAELSEVQKGDKPTSITYKGVTYDYDIKKTQASNVALAISKFQKALSALPKDGMYAEQYKSATGSVYYIAYQTIGGASVAFDTKASAIMADISVIQEQVSADMTNSLATYLQTQETAGTEATVTASEKPFTLNKPQVNTYAEANATITAVQEAINKVSSQRSALGALQNRLEHTIANLDNVAENTQAAESRIRDLDMAAEMVEYSKNNILAQAGQSMLAQANQATQGVLSLLQ